MTESHSDSISTRRLRDWKEVAEIEHAWADLVGRTACSSVFQTFRWHAAWWETFGKDHELLVVVCQKGQQLIGIAPMMVSTVTGPFGSHRRQMLFIGCSNDSSDYLDFIIDSQAPEALDVLLHEIVHNSEDIDRTYLSSLPTHWENYPRTIKILGALGADAIAEPHQEAPCRILRDSEEDRKAANKSSLRRRYNYFKRSGELRFRRCESESEIIGYLDTFFEHHMARRELTDSPSQFLDPDQKSFYRNLVHHLLPMGWLNFDVVLFNGQPIAFHFGFEYANNFIWYKPTFDVAYSKWSPGKVLIKFLLEDAIERGLNEFDFTVGNESFKHRFANTVRQNDRITIFHTSVDHEIYRAGRALRKLKKRLRRLLEREVAA